jgi:hypothetical protein
VSQKSVKHLSEKVRRLESGMRQALQSLYMRQRLRNASAIAASELAEQLIVDAEKLVLDAMAKLEAEFHPRFSRTVRK